jgi:glycosyltransferase involved in cell wall biosynthesis
LHFTVSKHEKLCTNILSEIDKMEYTNYSPLISVVIPCRDHSNELRNCFQGLQKQTTNWPYEIIVVDSAADARVAATASLFPFVRLISSDLGLLPGAARNLGAQFARGEYIAFTDADCVPEPGWLDAALGALKKGATIVGGPVLDVMPTCLIATTDNLLQFIDFPPHRRDGPASYLPGCNIALSKTAFEELGGFPPNLPVGEDVIFITAAIARWPNSAQFVRSMQVRHEGRSSLHSFWRHHEAFGYYRAKFGLRLRPVFQRLGRQSIFAAMISLNRLPYFIVNTLRWNPLGLIRLITLLPLLLLGLAAWAVGFRRGCLDAVVEAT